MAAGRLEIRAAAEGDWDALKALRLAALRDDPAAFGVTYAEAAAYGDMQWRERAASGRYRLAFAGGEPAGLAAGVATAAGEFELIAMWVRPASRGTGAAGALVEAIKASAVAQGHARVVLSVAPDNARAVAFYRRQGFTFLPEWEALASHPHIRVQKMAWQA